MQFVIKKPHSLIITFFIAVLFSALVSSGSRSAAEPETPQQDTQEVAREIMKIQQDLGGSIVELPSAELDNAQQPASHPISTELDAAASSNDSVTALREASLQLDLVAHRLELLDLYSQADATRELAQRLREDARQLKRAASPEKPE